MMNCKNGILITVLMLSGSIFAQTIQEAAVPYQRPANVPGASDVQMRTLRFRPFLHKESLDKYSDTNSDKALDDFHVTRLEWVYLEASEPGTLFENLLPRELAKIQAVKDSGRIFGGTANASSGTFVRWDDVNGKHIKKHTVIDRSGHPVIGGHMRYWAHPQSPGCVNNPAFRQGHLDYNKKYLNAGATTMQRDEPSANYSYAQAGSGCFCKYCMEGFRRYLKEKLSADELKKLGVKDIETFDYKEYLNAISPPPASDFFDWSDPETVKRAGGPIQSLFVKFQLDSVTEFFAWLRKELQTYNGGVQIGYSCNNTSYQNWEDPYVMEFDYCISEMMLQTANPAHIYKRAQVARKLGKLQVFGTPKSMGADIPESTLVPLKQQVLATAFASGANGSVPWDVFMQSKDGNARYFCTPEDFAPLFGFVRANDRYLSGYCTAGGKGPGFTDNPYAGGFPVEFANTNLCVVLRAVPGKKDAPVVVHLIDWTKGAFEPVTLKLKTEAFFPGKKLSVKLRTPKAFDSAAHAAAETAAQAMRKNGELLGSAQASAYEPLVDETVLETAVDGGWTTITVPALSPWGLLVVKPRAE
jgi:hypothetical protein